MSDGTQCHIKARKNVLELCEKSTTAGLLKDVGTRCLHAGAAIIRIYAEFLLPSLEFVPNPSCLITAQRASHE